MSPLRIVLVMVEAPLPFGNAAARWFYVLLKGLVERGHRVTAFAACGKADEIEKARALFPAPAYDLRLYPFPRRGGLMAKWDTLRRPYSYMFGPEFRRDLEDELARGFDVLHLEQLWGGWVGLAHADRALLNVHHLVWIDLGESPPRSSRERLERWLMFRAERTLLKSFHHVRSCSPRLVGPIRETNPSAQVVTVPVGLDASLYPFIPDDRRTGEPTVTLIGSMAWYPGLSAAVRLLSRLWPEIKRRVPAARLQVVGWSARSALQDYLDLPDVTVVENVPDVQLYFDRTNVFVYAPSRGSGMKIKVLEAMAFGVPVVTTSEGVEGLPAVDGVHAGVCDDDAGLIDRAVALLNDADRQNRQRREARALIESHCGPGPTLDAIEAVYAEMLRNPR
jgi:glycosyltransferase involved in cell wall biosynthesis